ncbi:MAG: hypothetical protein DMG68_17340 [Acidobacteria bacterium]|nr:MAG: hypothetical protein DMG68_17340 [Acidobacteriota bacterium]
MQHFTNFAGKSRAGKRFSKQDESGFFLGAEWRDSAHEETGERRGGRPSLAGLFSNWEIV